MGNKKEYLHRLTIEGRLTSKDYEIDTTEGLREKLEQDLAVLKSEMVETDYEAWKEEYIRQEREGSKDWITAKFEVPGSGIYSYTLSEKMMIYGSYPMAASEIGKNVWYGDATDEEIRQSICINAYASAELEEEMAEIQRKERERDKSGPVAMRWGYDGGGIACGPVEGSTITEIMFRDREGKSYFVSATRMSEFVNLYVSEVSLYDIHFYFADRNANMDAEMQKVDKYSLWKAETELGGYEYIEESPYPTELKMVLSANDYYYNQNDDPDPKEWLDGVRNGDITIEYPKVGWDDEEDDEDEGAE